MNKSTTAQRSVLRPARRPLTMRLSSFMYLRRKIRSSLVSLVSLRILMTVREPVSMSEETASNMTSMTPTIMRPVSKTFQTRSLPVKKRLQPATPARNAISTVKKMANAKFSQNQPGQFSVLTSVCRPTSKPFSRMAMPTTGSMYEMNSGRSSGAARSSTRTCVNSATRRFASPENNTSRTVSACCTSSGSRRLKRRSSLRRASMNTLNLSFVGSVLSSISSSKALRRPESRILLAVGLAAKVQRAVPSGMVALYASSKRRSRISASYSEKRSRPKAATARCTSCADT
mmetsp:Transcript_12851/g.40357  ORF Transcript_12851/g.40357 Transcript_12851/m.40357 type:complete len:288 (+) Transcript_12851:982-1845(+)